MSELLIELFSFIEKSIILREESKFQFTKNLSDVLVLIREVGEELGVSLDDLSFLKIDTLHIDL